MEGVLTVRLIMGFLLFMVFIWAIFNDHPWVAIAVLLGAIDGK